MTDYEPTSFDNDDPNQTVVSKKRARIVARQGPRPDRPLMRKGLPTVRLTAVEEQALILNGSPEAREELIVRTMFFACSYGRHVCRGNLDGEDIFSACYDALTAACKNFKGGQQNFLAYSKPYIRGTIFKAWKDRGLVKKTTTLQLPSNNSIDDVLSPEAEDFDYEGIHRREMMDMLQPVMEKYLTEHERMVVELHDMGGMTFKDIGSAMDYSRSRAQQLYDSAIKKIRRHLKKIDAL
jgi:RNA polymerase sigma factor (sigma-70 family)